MPIGRVDGPSAQNAARTSDTERNSREREVQQEQQQERTDVQQRAEEATRRGEVDLSA